MYPLLKKFLFILSPETAHKLSFMGMKVLFKMPIIGRLFRTKNIDHEKLTRSLMNLTFSNPVGLAAGFDKDGVNIDEFANFGFGFIEVGTVTPKPQAGNPKPRLFRLVKDRAIINRMGFNNRGVDNLVENLKKVKNRDVIIGGNIGKNKVTPNERAVDDYIHCFKKLHDYVHYFVVNVSSPNTPNLRALQEKEPLKQILNSLVSINNTTDKPKPILLKIAPDLTDAQLDDIIEIVQETGIAGVIATNTTINRSNLKTSDAQIQQIGNGGLSGTPLTQRANDVVVYLRKGLTDKVIIGVGGIMNGKDAKVRMDAGADLVQVYSGFVYEGPHLIKKINEELKNS